MKYVYITATGKTEIEVDEQFYDLLVSMDNDEYNSDRKHSRRYPVSLENCEYEGEWFADAAADPLGDINVAVAADQGVSEAAIRDRLKRIYKRLKKSLE